jgi:magnesium-transporting ATPase (P-type)
MQFKVVRKMEFNSDRKRMSMVVLDNQDGLYKLFCKGADNVIKERLLEGQDTIKTVEFLEESAQQGYRTLLVAMRVLDMEEVESFL